MPLPRLATGLAPLLILAACATASPPLPPAPDPAPSPHERIPLLVATGSAVDGYRIGPEPVAPPADSLIVTTPALNGEADTVPAARPVTVRLRRLDHRYSPWTFADVPGTGRRVHEQASDGAWAGGVPDGEAAIFAALAVPVGRERAFPDRYDPEAARAEAIAVLRGIRETAMNPALWLEVSAEQDLSAADLAFLRASASSGVRIMVLPQRT